MNEYATNPTFHTKRRGRIRRCDWCGQRIIVGERYAKWLWFVGGGRSTAYAHEECRHAIEEQSKIEGGIVYFNMDDPRPEPTNQEVTP